MKNILIISYLFHPNNTIGALRATKMAKFLSQNGYTVDVVSADVPIEKYVERNEYVNNEYIINLNKHSSLFCVNSHICINNLERKTNQSSLKHNKIFDELRNLKRGYMQKKLMKIFNKNFKLLLNSDLFDIKRYDTVLSTFGPTCNVQCGLYCKKIFSNINWICDFRDPMLTRNTPMIYRPFNYFLQKNALKHSDKIVAVSNGYLKRICKGKYQNKSYMIPNGYDKEDIKIYSSEQNSVLNITYVGSLYEGKRDISVIFKVLSEIIEAGIIDKSRICFNYAGKDIKALNDQASLYKLVDIIKDHKMLSREVCLQLQFSSDLVVLSTWNYKNEYGVFPGKFLEYMLINKPIIAIVNGDLAESEVKEIMEEGDFGATYEYVNDSNDYPKLKEYLIYQINSYLNRSNLKFSPINEVVERYNYDNIIQSVIALL